MQATLCGHSGGLPLTSGEDSDHNVPRRERAFGPVGPASEESGPSAPPTGRTSLCGREGRKRLRVGRVRDKRDPRGQIIGGT